MLFVQIGDAYLVLQGYPQANPDHAMNALRLVSSGSTSHQDKRSQSSSRRLPFVLYHARHIDAWGDGSLSIGSRGPSIASRDLLGACCLRPATFTPKLWFPCHVPHTQRFRFPQAYGMVKIAESVQLPSHGSRVTAYRLLDTSTHSGQFPSGSRSLKRSSLGMLSQDSGLMRAPLEGRPRGAQNASGPCKHLQIRVGINTGPVAASTLGHKRNCLTLVGDTLNGEQVASFVTCHCDSCGRHCQGCGCSTGSTSAKSLHVTPATMLLVADFARTLDDEALIPTKR